MKFASSVKFEVQVQLKSLFATQQQPEVPAAISRDRRRAPARRPEGIRLFAFSKWSIENMRKERGDTRRRITLCFYVLAWQETYTEEVELLFAIDAEEEIHRSYKKEHFEDKCRMNERVENIK